MALTLSLQALTFPLLPGSSCHTSGASRPSVPVDSGEWVGGSQEVQVPSTGLLWKASTNSNAPVQMGNETFQPLGGKRVPQNANGWSGKQKWQDRNDKRPWEGAKNNFKLDFWRRQSTELITLNQWIQLCHIHTESPRAHGASLCVLSD